MLLRITLLSRVVLCGLFASTLPAIAEAQFMPRPGCGCRAPQPAPVMIPVRPIAPICVAPQPIVQQQLRPVVETHYRQQQVTTYQDVVKTQVRQEQHVVSVPVTTNRQVTVDEGGYKMVWVPNMVTKTVQETVMQQQVQQREVPYQVVERVPQVRTQLVPEQTVRYVQEYRTVYGTQQLPYTTATISNAPLAPIPMSAQAATVDPTQTAAAPGATLPEGEWKMVPQRQAAAATEIEQQSFESASGGVTGEAGTTEPRRLFNSRPVPTAVHVMQNRMAR